MMQRSDWDLVCEKLPSFAKGDVEWASHAHGIIYRGPVKAFSITENRTRINITFGWLAYLAGDRAQGDGWEFAENQTISMSKDRMVSARMADNNQLDFATELMSGTFYPPGQNLSSRRMKEFRAPHLRVVKK
jgi:hypothetical protein